MPRTSMAEQSRHDWDSVASAFDEYATPISMLWATNALRHVDIGPGRSLLDVGSGSGGLSIPAAVTGTTVTAVDTSPAMIHLLGERARAFGLEIDARVMDASRMVFPDDRFDVVASLNGASSSFESGRILEEMTRVTRHGGQVIVIAFGPAERSEWLGIVMNVLREVDDEHILLAEDGPPLAFQWSDANELRGRLREAALSEIRVITHQERVQLETGTALWDFFASTHPIGAWLAPAFDSDLTKLVIDRLDQHLAQRSWTLSTELNIGVGAKR